LTTETGIRSADDVHREHRSWGWSAGGRSGARPQSPHARLLLGALESRRWASILGRDGTRTDEPDDDP
jgi:hypothetical protein